MISFPNKVTTCHSCPATRDLGPTPGIHCSRLNVTDLGAPTAILCSTANAVNITRLVLTHTKGNETDRELQESEDRSRFREDYDTDAKRLGLLPHLRM